MCMYECPCWMGVGGWWWKSWDRVYEINITLTQSCSHGHACKPDYPKIGQWNTTQQTHMHTHVYTHTHTHAPVWVGRIRGVPVPCRLSATRVQCCHTHLPTEQTRPLDWNNRIKIRAERERDSTPSPSLPPSLTLCPTSLSKCYLKSTLKREKNKKKTSALALWRCSCHVRRLAEVSTAPLHDSSR